MNSKTFGAVRISAELNSKVESAIRKYNKENAFKISVAEFRKLSYKVLAEMILKGQIDLIIE